ncbi:GHMP family kinase ATP-binding protein [Enterococcus nangangensis]|uniref:GHMP family kinase ATP-binding protein n=1 Tax=Enterococcus nangangensis TaxID=2559926 RepID=UPI003FCDD8BC
MVPATSQNLGLGYSSFGLALSLYLTVEVLQPSNQWEIQSATAESVTAGMQAIFLKAVEEAAPDLTPQRIRIHSTIPVGYGLGEEVATGVAAIELANRLAHLGLSETAKIQQAVALGLDISGSSAAVLGGFLITDGENVQHCLRHYFPESDWLLFLPAKENLQQLPVPETLSFATVKKMTSTTNLLVGALFNGDIELTGKLLVTLQKYTEQFSTPDPHLLAVRAVLEKYQGYGSFIAGTGGGILALVPASKVRRIEWSLKELSPKNKVQVVSLDTQGIQVY